MINEDTTVKEAFAMCKGLGAGQINMVFRDEQDKPLAGAFFIYEGELAERIEETIKKWDEEQP